MNFVPLSITEFQEAVTEISNGEPEKRKSYHLAYQTFLRYFANLDLVTRDHLIIGAHFTYGWMPRMLTIRGDPEHDPTTDQLDDAARILTQVKRGCLLADEEMEHLANLINNSLVGASKLLHFVSPQHYVMWDSRVCAFLYGTNIFESRKREIARYHAYLHTCHSLTCNPAFPPLHQEILSLMGVDETPPLRSVEWVMYRRGSRMVQFKG